MSMNGLICTSRSKPCSVSDLCFVAFFRPVFYTSAARPAMGGQQHRAWLALRIFTDCGSGGCVCVPIWSFLCRQTIKITIGDHETVGDLKTKIAEDLDDPNRYGGYEVSGRCIEGFWRRCISACIHTIGMTNATVSVFQVQARKHQADVYE